LLHRCRYSKLVIIFVLGLTSCSDSILNSGNATPSTTYPLVNSWSSRTPHPTNTKIPPPSSSPSPTKGQLPAITQKPLEAPPTLTPTLLTCWSKGGIIHNASQTISYLRKPLSYRVYIPPCYHQQIDRRYPVLYLIHGQGFTDEQWDRIGVDEVADSLIASYEIPPLIIVMPHEYDSQPPQISKFAQAFIDDFIPYIEATYRTLPDRAHRAIGGLSRGGGWAIHFGVSEWELFGTIGAHSPGIFSSDNIYMRNWLDNIPSDSTPRIYLDIGSRDLPEILEPVIRFEELLNKRDIPHDWHYFSGFHNEEYWHVHLESYLRWYTLNW